MTPSLTALQSAVLLAALLGAARVHAQAAAGEEPEPTVAAPTPGGVEEIVVNARLREETLLEAPVTITAFTAEDLARTHVRTLSEASRLVPNLQIVQGNSGSGANLYLRGVGSSSISAAFDQSVAIAVDGVVANVGRLIHHTQLDLDQIEVLKGPQSLYFGKSAAAGVVSLRTRDPGDELELELAGAYELAYEQVYTELIASGPLTDGLGARLAVGWSRADRLRESLAPSAREHWRGEESTSARLTLVWEPLERARARLKLSYANYQNDGSNMNIEVRCADGAQQPTDAAFGGVLPNFGENCRFNGNLAISDVDPRLATGLPHGGGDGVPFFDQDTWLSSFDVTWRVAGALTLTSITGYLGIDHVDLDVYCYCNPSPDTSPAGVYSGLHRNVHRGVTQELRLASEFDGPLDFQAGLFFQDLRQELYALQSAVNAALLAGPDPLTGNGFDYERDHFLDTTAHSAFLAGHWRIVDAVELSAGARYTREEKDGRIAIPYMHAMLESLGFLPTGTRIGGLRFEDDNWSPEVVLRWTPSEQLSVYGAYKQGFKSGGIDNSALPNNTLDTSNPAFPGILIYGSEKARGGELGIRSRLAGGALRLDGTFYSYRYLGLQVQQFDPGLIQFATFNASELTTRGIELDAAWSTPLPGLSFRGALALTDADYTKRFSQIAGEDLNGQPRERSADFAGIVGASYDVAVAPGWCLGLSSDVRFSSGYLLEARLEPFEQKAFTVVDAALRLYSEDSRWELSVIARNLGDDIYAYSDGARPGAVLGDRITTTSLGREVILQLRLRL